MDNGQIARRVRTVFQLVAAINTAVAVGLIVAAPAAADDQSYLDHLGANGVDINTPFWGPGYFLQEGRIACDNVRHGADPQNGIDWQTRAMFGAQVVDAAQHELCPETLG
jgi:hypothetical protein